jgi:hypothetical protein
MNQETTMKVRAGTKVLSNLGIKGQAKPGSVLPGYQQPH